MEDLQEQLADLANWQQAHEIKDERRFSALDKALELITNHQEHFSVDLSWNTKISWGIVTGIGLLFITVLSDIISKLI